MSLWDHSSPYLAQTNQLELSLQDSKVSWDYLSGCIYDKYGNFCIEMEVGLGG